MNAPARIEMIETEEALELQPAEAPKTYAVAPSATPSDLLRIAVQQGADLDRLERLMALQERYEANEARKAFNVAMTEFKAEPLTIYKRKQVEFTTRDGDTTSYKHAELSDVTDVVGPAMARHGLSYRWDIKQGDGRINVSCIVTHALGHFETVTMDAAPDASGKKNPIQQIASAVQYLQRYTLLAASGMSTKGMDDDGRGAGDEGADEMLQDFRDASLEGTAALRAHYDRVRPDDGWWAKNSKALKDAAKLADSGVSQ